MCVYIYNWVCSVTRNCLSVITFMFCSILYLDIYVYLSSIREYCYTIYIKFATLQKYICVFSQSYTGSLLTYSKYIVCL